eukprot:TRINITY_DN5460_c0_g1_i1.p1 TRINITY_DN5460_c0_g1~~TRINITY_DN5460_c0_g1_i1.p1  ORF type:complete len:269 (-),score=84.90 TRINITY_DN5460_c0_g1_i1:226-1032(-)
MTACLSQGDEEDAACLNLRVMGEQSKMPQGMLMACLIQKAMEMQIVVGKYKAMEEGKSATGRYIPKIREVSSSVKQQTHHKRFTMHESNTDQGDVTIGTCQEDRSCAMNVVFRVEYKSVKHTDDAGKVRIYIHMKKAENFYQREKQAESFMDERVEIYNNTVKEVVAVMRDSSLYRDVEEVLAEQEMLLECLSSYQGQMEYEVAEQKGVDHYIGPEEKVKKEIKTADTSSKEEHLKMLKTRIFRPFLPGCIGLPNSGQLLIPAQRICN